MMNEQQLAVASKLLSEYKNAFLSFNECKLLFFL